MKLLRYWEFTDKSDSHSERFIIEVLEDDEANKRIEEIVNNPDCFNFEVWGDRREMICVGEQ